MKLCNPLLTCSISPSAFTICCTNCSKVHLQQSTPLLTRRHITQAGVHRVRHGPFAQVLLCLTSTDQLLCSPPVPQRSLSVPANPRTVRGPLQVRDRSFLQLSHMGAGLCLFPLLFHLTWLCGDFSYPFRCKRSCASFQQVISENCSICRCLLDVLILVREGKLNILLFLPPQT